jgi:hypothetical protein
MPFSIEGLDRIEWNERDAKENDNNEGCNVGWNPGTKQGRCPEFCVGSALLLSGSFLNRTFRTGRSLFEKGYRTYNIYVLLNIAEYECLNYNFFADFLPVI